MSQKKYILKQAKESSYFISIKDYPTKFHMEEKVTALELIREDGKTLFIKFDKFERILQERIYKKKLDS